MKKTRLTLMFVLMLLCVGLVFSLTSCGDDDNEYIHTPNSAVRENEIAATCASAGSYDEVVYCAECSEEISRTSKIIEKLSHTPSGWITDTEATCKAEGAKHKECTVCNEVLETGKIDKLTTHTPTEAVRENEVDSSCSKVGSYDEVVYCSVCEIELSRLEKQISLKNHTPSEWITDAEATCKAEGTKHKECTVCHTELETGKIDKLTTHTPAEAVRENEVDSSCSELGSYDEVVYCSVCEIELSRVEKEISKKDHIPSGWITDTEATCKVEGAKHKECTVCHEVLETGKIDKLTTHTPAEAVRENEVDSSCSELGSYDEVVYCSVCEIELSRVEKEISKKDHIPSSWITDTEATCKAEGAKHKECTECHTVLENETIDKLTTHTPAEAVRENEVDSSCSEVGSYDEVVYCSVCEIELSRVEKEISKKDHTPSGWITDTEATCKAEGEKHKECTVCHEVLESGVIALADHTPVVDSAVEATDTKDGLTEGSHCSFCGKVLVAQQIIPAKLQGTNVKSEQLTVDGDRIYGSVSNTTTIFSFLNDITVNDSASYIVARDIDCTQTIPSKTTTISIGDNVFYILVSNGNAMKLYTVTLRRLPTYTVSFNTNGGTALDSLTIEEGSDVSAPISEKAGYKLDGWAVNGELVSFPYVITSDVELEAVFSPIVYDITYEIFGGVNAEGNPDTYTIETSTIILDTPTRDYYDFAGWYDNEDFEGDAVTQIALGSIGDVVLYAKWTPTVYEIKYNLNGGVNAEENPNSYTVESDTIAFANPKRVGYTFKGWFVNEACTESITEILNGSHGKVEIYAKWEIIVYNIGYEPNGGVNAESNPDTYTIETSMITLATPTRDYYDFAGWYDNAEFEGEAITQIALGLIGDITLYAKWKPTVYEIKYNLNGGVNAEENPNSYTIESDTIILAAPARAGYEFIGWYYDAECTESITEILNGSHEKVEIYAKWEALYIVSNSSIIGLTDYAKNNVTELDIPSAIDGVQITSIGSSAFEGCTSLTSVTIGNGVTSIGKYAFEGCTSLTNVTIPDSVTSTGEDAFEDCTSLTSVHISDIAAWCGISFSYSDSNPLCYAHNLYLNGELVTELVIPDGVTSIGDYAFYGCTSLASVTIGNAVTSIGNYAFYGCTSLTSVYISDIAAWCGISFGWDYTNPLYYADDLYLNGELVTDLIIPDGVTKIPTYAFSCTSLTSITIPDSVTSIGDYAFYGCTSLASVTIGNAVTSIGNYAFYGCISLTSVTIPDSVTSIGNYAFDGCISLTSVHISDIATWCNIDFKYSGAANPLTYAKNLYLNGELVTELVIPDSVTSIGSSAFYGCTSLASVTIGNGVTSIGSSAFYGCTSLASVTIGNGVTSIGSSAFSGCTSLTSVTIGNGVTSIRSSAFENCTSLTSVTIGSGVTSIGNYAFQDCTSLTSVRIPDSVTSIGWSAFEGCISLTSITVLDGNTAYKSIDGNLYTKDGATLIQYALGKTNICFVIPDSVTSIGSSAFEDCTSLTSVTIGSGVMSIGDYAFYGCTSLTSVYISDIAKWCGITFGITFGKWCANPLYYANNLYLNGELVTELVIPDSVTSIKSYAFSYCTSLTSVRIPDSVTSIGDDAFYECTSLASVTIGNGVTSIGNYAFDSCTSLTSVYYTGTKDEWAEISIGSNNSSLTNATRYYYSEVEPTLNVDGTAYDGNYWYYDENGNIVEWVYNPEE